MTDQIDQTNQVWKRMNGEKYNNINYDISNYGNIRQRLKGDKFKYNPLRLKKSNDPFTTIVFNGAKKKKETYIKFIVSYYFDEHFEKYPYLIHIDRNVKNNYFKNLKWVDMGEMAKYNYDINRTRRTNDDLIETNNLDNTNFIKLGTINVENEEYDFSNYFMSKDGKTIINMSNEQIPIYVIKKLENTGYYCCTLICKKTGDTPRIHMHKLINHYILGNPYNSSVVFKDKNIANFNVDNLNPLGIVGDNLPNNDITTNAIYKVNPPNNTIIEKCNSIDNLFTDRYDKKLVIVAAHNNTIFQKYQWRLAKDENDLYTVSNNIIIDNAVQANNNVDKVNDINEYLKESCLYIEYYTGSGKTPQTFHCVEYEFSFRISWENLQNKKQCYMCEPILKKTMAYLLPIYKYNYKSMEFVARYDNIDDLTAKDLLFEDNRIKPNSSAKMNIIKNCKQINKYVDDYIWSFLEPINGLYPKIINVDELTHKRLIKLGLKL